MWKKNRSFFLHQALRQGTVSDLASSRKNDEICNETGQSAISQTTTMPASNTVGPKATGVAQHRGNFGGTEPDFCECGYQVTFENTVTRKKRQNPPQNINFSRHSIVHKHFKIFKKKVGVFNGRFMTTSAQINGPCALRVVGMVSSSSKRNA